MCLEICFLLETFRVLSRRNAPRFTIKDVMEVYQNGTMSDIKRINRRISYRYDHEEFHLLDNEICDFFDYIHCKRVVNGKKVILSVFHKLFQNEKINTLEAVPDLIHHFKLNHLLDSLAAKAVLSNKNDLAILLIDKFINKKYSEQQHLIPVVPAIDEFFHIILESSYHNRNMVSYILEKLGYKPSKDVVDFQITQFEQVPEYFGSKIIGVRVRHVFKVEWLKYKREGTPKIFFQDFITSHP